MVTLTKVPPASKHKEFRPFVGYVNLTHGFSVCYVKYIVDPAVQLGL